MAHCRQKSLICCGDEAAANSLLTDRGNHLKAFLHHLAEITRCREHDHLDLAAIIALQQLTGAVSVTMLDVTQANDNLFVAVKAVAEQHAVQTYFDSMPGTAPESQPAPCPQLLVEGIQRHASKVEARDENGLYLMWLPVWLNDRIQCCIRLSYQRRCDDEIRLAIEGIVTVYANHQDLLDYSERDSLTGLLNRKTFDARFARMTAQCVVQRQTALPGQSERRHSEQARENWLAVVDIDHFKRINDRFGHLYGDEVLILLANLLKSSFRANERIFRFGGEEFVILLRSATLENATMVFERLRKAIEQYPFPQVGQVTISLGFVSISGDTPVVVLGHADQALYYAKQHGRNQVQLYDRLVAENLLHAQDASGSVEFF
jgi:diguanylate cyclase (GGDEF)-like protein